MKVCSSWWVVGRERRAHGRQLRAYREEIFERTGSKVRREGEDGRSRRGNGAGKEKRQKKSVPET
jgi:hypothetical protein